MDEKKLAKQIITWIEEDVDDGECDALEWIEDLKKYLEGKL
jgi:hypothetical protein